jgi:transaldolase
MRIFLDTADAEAIRRAADTGLLDGVTTNPSKIAAAGRPYRSVVKDICGLIAGPVSVEAVAATADDLVREAVDIAKLAPNVVVKVPVTPEGLKAARILEAERGVRVNVTMVFAADQACLAMKTGASFVSVVLSRLDATSADSLLLVEDAMAVKRAYGFRSSVIAASLKHRLHVLGCLRAGCDVVTIPEDLFFQMFTHPLTAQGLAEFDRDWEKVRRLG